MNTRINKIIKLCKYLDDLGQYKASDRVLVKLAYYYPGSSDYTGERWVKFEDIAPEIKRDDKFNQVEKPNKLKKEYYPLEGNTDEEKSQSIFSINNTDDAVPGPAAIDPASPASSPSQGLAYGNATLNDYTMKAKYDQNVQDGNAWKNRIPER